MIPVEPIAASSVGGGRLADRDRRFVCSGVGFAVLCVVPAVFVRDTVGSCLSLIFSDDTFAYIPLIPLASIKNGLRVATLSALVVLRRFRVLVRESSPARRSGFLCNRVNSDRPDFAAFAKGREGRFCRLVRGSKMTFTWSEFSFVPCR